MFEADHEDGSLEVMATAPLPLELAAAAKALAHWISTGIPLALLAPVLGLLLNLDLAAYPALVATMLAGTPAISFLGAAGAALTLRARRGGLLLALLVLPLYVPTLIFGISAMSSATLWPRRLRGVVPDPLRDLARVAGLGPARSRRCAAPADAVSVQMQSAPALTRAMRIDHW